MTNSIHLTHDFTGDAIGAEAPNTKPLGRPAVRIHAPKHRRPTGLGDLIEVKPMRPAQITPERRRVVSDTERRGRRERRSAAIPEPAAHPSERRQPA